MNFIKELRLSINFSQIAFADLLGVSVASLRRWEAGDTNPSQLASERINHVKAYIEKGNLEQLFNERKEKMIDTIKEAPYRDFTFNGENHKIQYMPYVFNGPKDQIDFYNHLISMQEKKICNQTWEQYSRKLSIVQKADNISTEQYLLEHPKENAKSWSADSGAHGWHRYVGRFPAQLVRAICNFFDLSENDLLLDPFCGSGTFPIEAAMMAANIAPGMNRSFTAESWMNIIPKKVWYDTIDEANDLIQDDVEVDIQGYDLDSSVIKIARRNAREAGVDHLIHFQERDVKDLHHPKKYGFVITNPPYGERLEDKKDLPALYRAFGESFKHLDSWSAYMITSYEEAERYFGRKADKNRKIYNGMLKTYFYQFLGPKPPKKPREK